ncbi:hypothetical protein K1719_028138 [Acacia pycnantha]|nr:hypothetical protein K1719_028138 [Acacia pycnantha]
MGNSRWRSEEPELERLTIIAFDIKSKTLRERSVPDDFKSEVMTLLALGGYLELFMSPIVADLFQIVRRELDDLIRIKLLLPRTAHKLLSAVWLLIRGNHCEGRVIFNHQALKPPKLPSMASQPVLASRIESGLGKIYI